MSEDLYIKVTNKINKIGNNGVVFAHTNGATTGLRRIDASTSMVIWMLRNDGIYVHKEYVKAYKLSTEPLPVGEDWAF